MQAEIIALPFELIPDGQSVSFSLATVMCWHYTFLCNDNDALSPASCCFCAVQAAIFAKNGLCQTSGIIKLRLRRGCGF